jgi:peptide/nickel transport system substrate-binding protein
MKPKYRKLFVPLVALFLPGAALAAPSGTLIIAENLTPENLDPANAQNSTVNQLMLGMYDTLVQFTAGETTVSPRLATDWSASADGLAYTFNLRKGVTFHDGSALTADDVCFTFDRNVAAGANSIQDAGPYASCDIVDDHTVQLNLSAPYGPFISAMGRVYIVNKDLVEPHMGDNNARTWLAVNEAGSGPYALKTYKPDDITSMTAYSDYWGGWDGNHVAEVVFRVVYEPSTQAALLKAGEVHIAPDLTMDDKIALQGKDGYITDIGAAATPLYFMINVQAGGPISNRLFRKALIMAVDNKILCDIVLQGFCAYPEGSMPSDWPGHVSGLYPDFDLDGAKKIIDDNGWAGTEVALTFLPEENIQTRAAEQWQANLAKIGVTLVATESTWPAMAATTRSLDTAPDVAGSSSFPPFPDPHGILFGNFHTKMMGINGGTNFHQYSNPEVDDRLDRAAASADQAERMKLYGEVQEITMNDYVHVLVAQPASVVTMSDKVVGYKYNVAHHQTFNVMDIGLK